MNWFTDRTQSAATVQGRPWLPPTFVTAADEWHDGEAAPAPSLTFDEGEMAHIAAATSLRATHQARATCAADQAARLAEAMERMAEALAEAGRRHACEDAAALRRTVQLAAAIARAMGPAATDAHALASRIEEMLAGLSNLATAKLIVAPSAAEDLRPLLPEIAARAGFGGSMELRPDPSLAEGALQIVWPGGWLEHDPATLVARLNQLQATHDANHLPSATDGSRHEHDPT